jgi:tetratricopeptide (TPR) repeat protein
VLTCHSLIDFDIEFFLFWAILLLCLDTEPATVYHLRNAKIPSIVTVATLLLLCAWLGLGDLLYQSGNYEKALKIAPFHTDALAASLKTTSDPDELDRLSDRILNLNPTHSLAYSAKANAAFARGNITDMIHYKEVAIQYAPYSIAEYCDYIEKLYIVMELYVKSADQNSAAFCLEKILSVPERMNAVASKTNPLAWRTGNNTEMVLPDSYLQLLEILAENNPNL